MSFNVVPDFENPSDFDGDNIYEVELTVTDTAGLSDRQLLTVDIINVTRGFTPSLNLDELDGSNGFVINGIDENDSSGQIVSQAGDINGDGISDVIISTPYASNAPGDNAIYGESYVVFGRKDRNKSSVNLAELDGSNGFIITRSEDASRFRSVSGAGDINGDGIDDLVVGLTSFIDGDNSRETYVIFGGQDFSSGELDLLTLDGSNGFAIEGAATEFGFGDTVSGAGDVNGDGIDDLVIGAARVSIGSIERAGKSYVVFGGQDFSDGQINLKTLDGSNGFVIDGIDPDGQLGYSVSGAGDLNGDDFDDVILGARNGKSYVIFGRQNFGGGSFDLQELDGRNGIIITGDRSARSVSSAGDFNSDGVDDVIIGSRGISSLPATSYIVFGRKNFSESNLNLLELDTGSGVMLSDESRGSLIASSAGDINGDGIDDVIIGNPSAAKGVDRYDNPNVGKSYVVFGSQNLSTNRLDLSELDGSNGFVAIGSSVADFSGESVSGAGDINGDGISDIIIGAGGGDPNGVLDAGESYVIFGSTSDAPLVSISRVFRITEGTPFVVDVDAEDNLDAEGVGLIYSISNSLDQSLFTIDAVTGELSFITAPTFDNPSDADGDNTYEVAVTVTDSDGLSDTRDLTISITPASFTVVNSNNGDRLLFPDGAGEIVVSSFDIDEGREFGRSERSFDALSILDGAFQGDYSTTRDFLDLTFAIENDFDSSTDALRDGDALIFNFGNGDELRLEDVFGRDGLTVERFEANGGDIFTPDAVL